MFASRAALLVAHDERLSFFELGIPVLWCGPLCVQASPAPLCLAREWEVGFQGKNVDT